MEKILALIALMVLSGATFAGDDLDIFGQGENDEFQFERFSEDEVFAPSTLQLILFVKTVFVHFGQQQQQTVTSQLSSWLVKVTTSTTTVVRQLSLVVVPVTIVVTMSTSVLSLVHLGENVLKISMFQDHFTFQ